MVKTFVNTFIQKCNNPKAKELTNKGGLQKPKICKLLG